MAGMTIATGARSTKGDAPLSTTTRAGRGSASSAACWATAALGMISRETRVPKAEMRMDDPG